MTPPSAHSPLRRRAALSCLALAYLGLCIYAAGAPFSISLREIGGSTASGAVVLYYLLDWRGARLPRTPLLWAFLAFAAVLVLQTVHTIHPSLSGYALTHAGYKALLLFAAGMEAIRTRRQLLALAGVFGLAALVEGSLGTVQWITGVEPLTGDPLYGSTRLTGTMSTPRVGNWLSMAIPAALGLWGLLPRSWPSRLRSLVLALVLVPSVVTLVGSQTRSAWLGTAAALGLLGLLRLGWKKALGIGLLVLILAVSLFPNRFTPEVIRQAPRTEIWATALETFAERPVLGWGLNTFNPAYKQLGITLQRSPADLPHPHNIYLQLLVDGGLLGFLAGLAFLWGAAWWCLRAVRLPARPPSSPGGEGWLWAAQCFTASYVGYLVTAATAHNLFRTWWLGTAMTILGCALAGAWLAREAGERKE
ncbi:O-antigen ligase family protein [Desulfohalovibrio reitneri]|uniref:O-antigen ligase family protein n=1 Tax=Desulfohalovibrio reitneri TaxID=1307759 RepID=UPI0004A76865|nr:O-antigen ligase family protein [Desulfohalovibrio reitneri]